IIVYPEDFEFDEGSTEAIESSNQVKQVAKTLTDFTMREPTGAKRRLHLHFLHAPVAILGEDQVTGLRTERQELDGTGGVNGTGSSTTGTSTPSIGRSAMRARSCRSCLSTNASV